jgi:predicted nucleotidyltransferase
MKVNTVEESMETTATLSPKRRESMLAALQDYFQKEGERFEVEMAFLYGSQAYGTARLDSDVDVAVVFGESLKERETFKRIAAISLGLMTVLGLEVNVLPIYHDFRKPMLYYNAIVKGLPIFARRGSTYSDLRHEAMCQMEDFRVFGTRWQLQAAKRNLSRG